MSDILTNEASAADDVLSEGMQKLNMEDDKAISTKDDIAAPTIGADEAKDSESGPDESIKEPLKGRVFVGGISWRTTDTELRVGCRKLGTQSCLGLTSIHALQEYFGKFGDIKDCLVCKDQWTGKSRGFGFLSFENPEGVFLRW